MICTQNAFIDEKTAKISPPDPEITVLRAIIKKIKKKEINASKIYSSFNKCAERLNQLGVVSARCNIYISRLCHDASPSVRLSVTEVHWRIIANLGFKFRSHFTAHWLTCCCGRRASGGRRAACGRIISRHASQC